MSLVGSFLGSAGSVVKVTTVELADHTPTPVSTPATQMLYWVLGESPARSIESSMLVVTEICEVKVFWK